MLTWKAPTPPPEREEPATPRQPERGNRPPRFEAVGGFFSSNDTKRDRNGKPLQGGATMRKRGFGKQFR